MIKIIKQEIKISHELKSKVEWACKLNSTKPIFINGGLLKLEPTNIDYIEPHRAIINNKTYLLFNGHELVPDFKIASAIIHYDETSPHLHIVGVPIKYKSKNGMNKQVGKDKEREDYWKVSKDMYEHDIFSDDTIETIKDDYIWNKENDKHKDKGRDDFEL